MAAGGELLTWNIPPKNGHEVYFSRDIYKKYSLAPTLTELLLLSKRQTEDHESVSSSEPGSRTSSKPTAVETGIKPSANIVQFQEPRIPYPCFSSLTEGQQKRYFYLLSRYAKSEPNPTHLSQQKEYSQYLQMKGFVSKEVVDFLKFAQNAAKSCTKDYNAISEEAFIYAKKFLSACISFVKKYPECYTLHEIASIMGGKFSADLTLKLEKSLLSLGKVRLIAKPFPKLPAQIQVPISPEKKLDFATPEQRAAFLHNDISLDPNAEKLALKYCPQVVLASESLYTLLNNHGLTYGEQWELPISVKVISAAGCSPVKVVYIDPPLPKKEVTVREKNQAFQEFLFDFHTTKQSFVLARAVLLDKAPAEPPDHPNFDTTFERRQGQRMQVSDSSDIFFDADITEVETFGSTSKLLEASKSGCSSVKPISNAPMEPLKTERELADICRGFEEGRSKSDEKSSTANTSGKPFSKSPSSSSALGTNCEENPLLQGFESMEVDSDVKKVTGVKEKALDNNVLNSSDKSSSLKKDADVATVTKVNIPSSSDTDDEPLVIDTEYKQNDSFNVNTIPSNQDPVVDTLEPPCSGKVLSEPLVVPSDATTNQETNDPHKSFQRLSKELDPVGQILKMQTELLKSPPQGQPQVISEKSLNPPSQVHPILPPSVASAPGPAQITAADTSSSPIGTWASHFPGSRKGLLCDAVEDHAEYEPPQQGNLIYKLFSLGEMLVLVRCAVQKVKMRPHNKKAKNRRHFPVYVLPKLEYQAFYGAEALTESEVCRMWTESLLHSNCSFVVGHIDALTSNLFLHEELSVDDLKRRFGTFKPASSLNILQHVLKKTTSLQEGSYLLAHAAGDSSVTIYKSCRDKTTRASYNLHTAHSDLPGVPSTLSVPWVPLDPNIPLPYHFAQQRVPCTFPPKPMDYVKKQKMSGTKASADTPNHKKQVSMETNSTHPPGNPFRKNRRAAQKKPMMRNVYRQASRGANWKFWNTSRSEPT